MWSIYFELPGAPDAPPSLLVSACSIVL